jgi:protein-S-isoprenylcysteine O-methyltransferase Ste14
VRTTGTSRVGGKKMTDLNKKAFGGLLRLVVTLAAMLFVPAWTLAFWQAWVFLVVFCGSALAITVTLMKNDPLLLQRRINAGPAAETRKIQKIIMFFAFIAFVVLILVPAIDHRYAWSVVPPAVSIAADFLIAAGFLAIFFVFRENSFTSSVIEVGAGQKVVSTGPYALVRHPMYCAALFMLTGVPPALGSWWGLLAMPAITLVLAWRLLDEEKFLVRNLAGYAEYQAKVRYRLIPLIW